MTTTSSTLELTWPNGTTSSLPHLWLRDNCACSDCRVEQTTEKKIHLIDVPVDLAPKSVRLEGDVLHLVWPDGHNTSYNGAEIRALSSRKAISWQVWGKDFQPRKTDFARFLKDDPTAIDTIADFLQTGVAILTDAPIEANRLEDLVPRLGPIREVLFERIHNVEIDPGGYNVAHTALPLPPHNDFASYTWPPSMQALHMLVNETPGGNSIVVDGWHVLNQLRADAETIACALLHDIGDVIGRSNHSQIAAALLRPYVSEQNCWVVEYHGLFQGYYWFQHYDRDRDARERYKDHPYYQACVDFCARWDQCSFDPDYATQPLEHFAPLVRDLFARAPKEYV